MRNFLTKILVFCFLFFIVEKAAYFLLRIRPSFEVDKRIEWMLEGQLNKDILVLGPSSGSRNILAGMMEDSLNMSAYNLADYSANIVYSNFIFQTYLKFNEAPKLLCLSVSSSIELQDYKIKSPLIYREDKLIPYLKYRDVNEEFIRRGKHSFITRFMYSPRLRMSHFNFKEKSTTYFDTILPCGSKPILYPYERQGITYLDSIGVYNEKEDVPEKVAALRSIIDTCETKGIKLLILIPPFYRAFDVLAFNHLQGFESDFCEVVSYDTLDSRYLDTAYYYDWCHLNIDGAIVYTNELIQYIRTLKL